MANLISQSLLVVCTVLSNLFFMALVGFFRNLPAIARLVVAVLQMFLRLSFRLYSFLFTRMAPAFRSVIGINILTGKTRVVASATTSLVLGAPILFVTGLPIVEWSIGAILIHGVLVGLTWDEQKELEGLQMGTPIK